MDVGLGVGAIPDLRVAYGAEFQVRCPEVSVLEQLAVACGSLQVRGPGRPWQTKQAKVSEQGLQDDDGD